MNFWKQIKNNEILIIDGAMGSLLFQKIPDYTGCFELLNIEQPEIIKGIHQQYLTAGANIVETNTFGANSAKLKEYGLENHCFELNKAGAQIAKEAMNGQGYVAGSIGPTGYLVEPIVGGVNFETIYSSYVEQVKGLAAGGADLIAIETMNDLQEAKIAVMAAKDNCDLPIICNMTFEPSGKTFTGTDIITAFSTVAAYGADIVGTNCSMGPEGLYDILSAVADQLKELDIPLAIWANAGLPQIKNDQTVYPMDAKKFGKITANFVDLGFSIIGGCCGTTPQHITQLKKNVAKKEIRQKEFAANKYTYITNRFAHINISSKKKFIKVGERLNPTARKKFLAELKAEETHFLKQESVKQKEEGADILDINVGVPNIDEVKTMQNCIKILANTVNIPLMIDSDNPQVIEAALKLYPGIPIINSINGKESSIQKMIPVLKRYGSFIVALCLDENGIQHDATARISIGEKIITKLKQEGITENRIIIDPLMLAESADPGSALETLKVIKYFSEKGIKTSIGLSNISFGLPSRKYVNNMFLSLAIENGLSMAIVNPNLTYTEIEENKEYKLAYDFLIGQDLAATNYINYFSKKKNTTLVKKEKKELSSIEKIYEAVLTGDKQSISDLVHEALKELEASEIMNKGLLKGLEKVGDLYSSGTYFLPQMMASAEAMKTGFDLLKPILSQTNNQKLGKIVICTVHGDSHDIGKNIVAMMLENHGFEIIDLGKDVPTEKIIRTIKEEKADIICLSSLLTTTMPEMKNVVQKLAEEKIEIKVMIGGAVVNNDYAQTIGAFYSDDAVSAVKLAKKLLIK